MARFEVDSEQIQRASGSTAASATAIRNEVSGMMQHLVALQDVWKGSASTAFAGVVMQWKATQQQVDASLDAISLSLQAGSQQYEDAESSTLRMFSAR